MSMCDAFGLVAFAAAAVVGLMWAKDAAGRGKEAGRG
jgi:hypothetical protein